MAPESASQAPASEAAASEAGRPAVVWAFIVWAGAATLLAVRALADAQAGGVVLLAVFYAMGRGVLQRNRRQRVTSQVMCAVAAAGALAFVWIPTAGLEIQGAFGLSGEQVLYSAAAYWGLGLLLLSLPSMRAHTQLDPEPQS